MYRSSGALSSTTSLLLGHCGTTPALRRNSEFRRQRLTPFHKTADPMMFRRRVQEQIAAMEERRVTRKEG